MPSWLKIVISAATGFATGAVAAKQAGAKTKGILLGGVVTAVIGLGNLTATSPIDQDKEVKHESA